MPRQMWPAAKSRAASGTPLGGRASAAFHVKRMVFGLSGADQVAQSVSHGCHFAQVGWERTRMFPAFAETNSGGRLFYWNLDGSVGLRGANRFDDVMFVQWCLYKTSKWDGLDRGAKGTAGDKQGPAIREPIPKNKVHRACTARQTHNLR